MAIPGTRASALSLNQGAANCRKCGACLAGGNEAATHLWEQHHISMTPKGALEFLRQDGTVEGKNLLAKIRANPDSIPI